MFDPLALKDNRSFQASALDVSGAVEETAGIKTERLPQFHLYLLGGGTLRPIEFTIRKAAMGIVIATA